MNLVAREDRDECTIMRYMAKVIQNLHYQLRNDGKRRSCDLIAVKEGSYIINLLRIS